MLMKKDCGNVGSFLGIFPFKGLSSIFFDIMLVDRTIAVIEFL